MKKTLVAALVLLVLGAAMVPAWAQGVQVSFSGTGNARALDLSVPALRALGLQNQFKGLTVGLTSSTFDISPSAKSVSGFAAGKCDFIATQADPNALPCDQSTLEASSAASPGGKGACADNLTVTVVSVSTSCGKSSSSLTAAGLPSSLNDATIANVKISADLSALGLEAILGVEAKKDQVLTVVSDLTSVVFQTAPSSAQTNALKDATEDFLNSIKDGNQFAVVKVGAASTNVIPTGDVTTLTSEAAGAKIGLLGLTDALQDGLVIIEISSGVAKGTFNGVTGVAEASAAGPLATVKVRDLIDLAAGDYIVQTVPVPALPSLLGALNNTALETSVEAGTYTKDVQTGKSVSAFTSGVTIHALKGLGESAAGAKDGGLIVRVASADVKLAGNLVSAQAPCCALATTGGPVYAYLAGAALLALMALMAIVMVRRLRTTSS